MSQLFSSSVDDEQAGKTGQKPLLGILAFLAAALSSAFATVFLERMLKTDRKPSLWLRNIQLAIYGSIAIFGEHDGCFRADP